MKSRIIFTVIALAAIVMGLDAQEIYYNSMRMISERQFEELLVEQQTRDAAHRLEKSKVLPIKNYLLGDTAHYWSNGRFVCVTMYDSSTREVEFYYDHASEPTKYMQPSHFLKIAGNKVRMKEKPHYKVTVEQLGTYTMLVYRNESGAPIHAYYSLSIEQWQEYRWCMAFYHLLAGNYTTANERNTVFGPRLPFYTGNKYDVDPGIFAYHLNTDYSTIDILYGGGRVSHGDPSSPNYDKMPGGGGAGAIMGPMEWKVRFTVDGLLAWVVSDERFVDHSPRLEDGVENVLTKVQCPWEGIDGKWAFASVLPLTDDLLRLFPKDVLELARAEIYARHGDTFKSAANQKYFDHQPWYKKSGKPVVLSDIEKFNVALIKQVMATQ